MKRTIVLGFFLAVVIALAPLASITPTAQAANASPSGSKCVYHYVKLGETLSSIAYHYGVNMWTIAQRNGLANINRIYAGQRLLIYCYTPKPPPPKPKPPLPPSCTAPSCQGNSGYYPPPTQPGDGGAACSIQPQLGFGNVWYRNPSVSQKLGCPAAPEQGFSGAQEAFHSGFVIAADTTGAIYVMYNNGTWQQFHNTWTSSDPVYNPGLIPPAGWCQPEYGIGKVWRNEDNVSQRLGWARSPAQSVTGSLQQYQGGLMLWTSSTGVWVLYNDGTYKRF